MAQELEAQDCTSLCPKNKCHPRVRSRSLPHLTLTTSTSSLSHPFHLLLFSFGQSHLHTQALWSSTHICPAMFHGRVADQHKSYLSHLAGTVNYVALERNRFSCGCSCCVIHVCLFVLLGVLSCQFCFGPVVVGLWLSFEFVDCLCFSFRFSFVLFRGVYLTICLCACRC